MAAYDKKVIEAANSNGDFVTLEDGFVYYMPSNPGALGSQALRAISEELDARNAEWSRICDYGEDWESRMDATCQVQLESDRRRTGNLAPEDPNRKNPSYWVVPEEKIEELKKELDGNRQPSTVRRRD